MQIVLANITLVIIFKTIYSYGISILNLIHRKEINDVFFKFLSGHIIVVKFATTGDGLLVALEVLFALRKGKKTSEFFQSFKKTPQLLENITVKDKNIINKPEIKKVIKLAEKLIKGQGRVLVRKSGTESKIRVMAESDNKILLSRCVNMISKKIK